jgi:uncharacterized repeat protein (TIGR03803 family)
VKNENSRKIQIFLMAVAILLTATVVPAQTEGILHSFQGGATDGADARAGVIADSSGNLYGTAAYYGPNGQGVVYKLTPPTRAGGTWTENVLYSFSGGNDGATPVTNLVMDSAGAIYGATANAGANNCGTFFQLLPSSGGGVWTENTLFDFPCASHGAISGPVAIIRDPSTGIMYGTVQNGGPFYGGWIYQMVPPTSGRTWTNSVLHNFNANPGAPGYAAGCVPWSLILTTNGYLYGTALDCGASGGTVFRLTPPATGTNWTLAVLYTFGSAPSSANGFNPFGLIFGKGGVLYGTTGSGGSAGLGIVYSLTPNNTGSPWTESIIHNFTGSPDGNSPLSGVVLSTSGVLYGTTGGGGLSNDTCGDFPGCGIVFQLSPGSSGWTETILHNFASTGGDAMNPNPGPLLQRGGNLYGATYNGGADNDGAVYAIHP